MFDQILTFCENYYKKYFPPDSFGNYFSCLNITSNIFFRGNKNKYPKTNLTSLQIHEKTENKSFTIENFFQLK